MLRAWAEDFGQAPVHGQVRAAEQRAVLHGEASVLLQGHSGERLLFAANGQENRPIYKVLESLRSHSRRSTTCQLDRGMRRVLPKRD